MGFRLETEFNPEPMGQTVTSKLVMHCHRKQEALRCRHRAKNDAATVQAAANRGKSVATDGITPTTVLYTRYKPDIGPQLRCKCSSTIRHGPGQGKARQGRPKNPETSSQRRQLQDTLASALATSSHKTLAVDVCRNDGHHAMGGVP